MTSYIEKINQYIQSLDAATLEALEQLYTEKQYRKGELLLRADDVCTKSFLLLKGIARKYFLHGDKDVTTELYFTNDLAVSFDSYTLQQPSRECIQALTDVTVQVLPYRAFQEAKAANPALVQLDLMLAEYYAMWVERRLQELRTVNATDRYLHLLEKSPHIVQRVPLAIIASYLDISQETLSRIRSRM